MIAARGIWGGNYSLLGASNLAAAAHSAVAVESNVSYTFCSMDHRSQLDRALQEFHWRSFTASLRNTRQAFAREHPLFVFKAIFLHASRFLPQVDPDQPKRPYVFHPASTRPFHNRLKSGQTYELELLFPGQTGETLSDEQINQFQTQLRQHLANPENNFEVIDISEPVEQSVPLLIDSLHSPTGISGIDPVSEEICLDFLTPFRWNRPQVDRDAKIRWRFQGDQLLLHLARRAASLLPGAPNESQILNILREATAEAPIETLPYYWHFEEFTHRAKSTKRYGTESVQRAFGMAGPLYLRGPGWSTILPLLLLSSSWHLGNRIGQFQGHFRLATDRPFFDLRLNRRDYYRRALEKLEENNDEAADALAEELLPKNELLDAVQEQLTTHNYVPQPAGRFSFPKKNEGEFRTIAILSSRDMLVHRVVLEVATSVFDRMFEDASIGYRTRRSPNTARKMIAEAVREGCSHVVESDIEEFFDEIDHQILRNRLNTKLPQADKVMRGILDQILTQPWESNDRTMASPRIRGLLQGSPLSPLLANFYLDPFDEAIETAGYRMIRYGDDFVILCRSHEEAQNALKFAEKELTKLGLNTKEGKTALTPIDLGFNFLGIDMGTELHEVFVEQTAMRKPVFIGPDYSFVGISGNTLTIKRDGKPVGQAPLHRVSEVVLLGQHGVSTRLLHYCSDRRIPVSFCSRSGYYLNTLRPDSRKHYETLGRHSMRFEGLEKRARLGLARQFGHAKIANYVHWFSELSLNEEQLERREKLKTLMPHFDDARSVDQVRGIEGRATVEIFRLVNSLARDGGFKSRKRIPRRKRDAWNSLLDFGYFLLFARLNVLVRGQGLNPYLGFLHSRHDRYESLVCDLQEPFRARIDRFLLKLVNRKVILPEEFEIQKRDDGPHYRLNKSGSGKLIQAFEREMEIKLSGDPGKLNHLLTGQVAAVHKWAWSEHGVFPVYCAFR